MDSRNLKQIPSRHSLTEKKEKRKYALAHAPTCKKLKKQFPQEYKRDLDITDEDIMSIFLGMEVEQTNDSIKLYLVLTSKKQFMSINQ